MMTNHDETSRHLHKSAYPHAARLNPPLAAVFWEQTAWRADTYILGFDRCAF